MRRTLASLRRERQRHPEITLALIAAAATKTSRRGSVSVPTVSRVLSGDTKSANVVATAWRLIEEARAEQARGSTAAGGAVNAARTA